MGALKQAEIIPISKGRDKMTDKFEKGYVMSSRLYRSDVRPFLSDAARNVYAELEDRINGFKDKTTDFVSYSQLQGGKLEGSKKLSTTTVRKGLKELTDLGVVTVVSSDSRKGNEYRINEVSLVEHFKNCNTTLESKALQKVKREHFTNESASTLETKDTIELYKNIYRESDSQQNQVEEVLNIWKPDLQQLNSWMQRSGLPKINQAQVEELLLEINPHYENKIHTGAVTTTQMYSNFVKWVKRDFKLVEKLFKQAEQNNTQAINPSELKTEMGDW
ncbi:TPA: hypothetical protein U2N26_003381 [Acinetobacter nosocomialis]|uniref:hypothetical protein n=1 Tax=Acinetobacter calcoaceticus/baumannii complex TaxID=909768 RepID=UPI000DE6ADDC|nr:MULTISPECIES: hypothetical protein [Acinetobacter calcoaceticus/baumannii complex]MBJ8461647.1 hypothetical protein [Acinetobacter nosocomialis]MBZ6528816.1 hypothetical protein [Acinetobacter nosocomialis]MDH2662933.1 hypothetical protein [Acinetobacter baumannii]SSV66076.1 Uncharacterised protein [Acinetobacter nosocomialis]HEM7379980.1 hypothetical protein [Acinetobacter nosocomialis]